MGMMMTVTIPLICTKDEVTPEVIESMFRNGAESALDLLRELNHDFTKAATVELRFMPVTPQEARLIKAFE
jgi:hypothetical protein